MATVANVIMTVPDDPGVRLTVAGFANVKSPAADGVADETRETLPVSPKLVREIVALVEFPATILAGEKSVPTLIVKLGVTFRVKVAV